MDDEELQVAAPAPLSHKVFWVMFEVAFSLAIFMEYLLFAFILFHIHIHFHIHFVSFVLFVTPTHANWFDSVLALFFGVHYILAHRIFW